MKRRSFVWFLPILLATACMAAETSVAPENENSNEIRPTGVPSHRHRSTSKSSASANSDSDAEASATPRPRRTHRATKPRESDEEPVPTQTVPGSIPKTSASSIIVINVSNGDVLYEKNPDQIRA